MTDAEERWQPIAGYEGMYEVSDAGRVRSLDRWGARARMLTQSAVTGGYLAVKLTNRDRGLTKPIHVLVAVTFIGPRPPGHHVRHLDGDQTNNRLANLAYGTPSENVQDSIRHGTQAQVKKTHCAAGHSLQDPANVYRPPGAPTSRICIECQRVRARATEIRRTAKRAAERAATPPRPFCKYGHELSGSNLYVPTGKPNQRKCRTCRRAVQRANWPTRRATVAATRAAAVVNGESR